MLRLLVLLLVLANGGYFAWSQGLLRVYGFAPAPQGEPQRLTQQLHPEALRLLTPEEAKKAETAPPAVVASGKPAECLQAGLFDEAQATSLRRTLESFTLPAGAWTLDGAVEPARWIVYMGKYPTADALAKKRGELASLNLKFEPLVNPALEFGVSLGNFDNQAAADAWMAALSRRGVRTAHVVQERAELRGALLKLPAVDDALRPRLEELKASLAGKPLRTCK